MQLSSLRKSFKNFAEITTDEILIEQEEKLQELQEKSNSGKCLGTILFTLKFDGRHQPL
jgi:hypothetical protein